MFVGTNVKDVVALTVGMVVCTGNVGLFEGVKRFGVERGGSVVASLRLS